MGVEVARQVVACQGSDEELRINEKGHAATGELGSTWQHRWRRLTLLRVFQKCEHDHLPAERPDQCGRMHARGINISRWRISHAGKCARVPFNASRHSPSTEHWVYEMMLRVGDGEVGVARWWWMEGDRKE